VSKRDRGLIWGPQILWHRTHVLLGSVISLRNREVSLGAKYAWTIIALELAMMFALVAGAAVRSSTNFQMACDGIVTASGTTRSTSYSLYSVLEAVPGTATSSNYVVHSGCFGFIAEQRRDIIFENGFD
jgi:hypothetical protein